MNTAAETLDRARFASGIGDVQACLSLSDAALHQAGFEHNAEIAYRAAEVPGRMYIGRGEPREAVAHYRHALDVVLMHGLTPHLGGAYHDLALATRECGDRQQFREMAGTAFRLYHDVNPRDSCITGILADMASDAFERDPNDKDKARACLEQWRCVPASMRTLRYHLAAAANQMQCAAALGWRQRYLSASEALDTYLAALPNGEAAALTLAFAGEAALKMGDFARAFELANTAERVGVERDEPVPVEQAIALREAALAEQKSVRT